MNTSMFQGLNEALKQNQNKYIRITITRYKKIKTTESIKDYFEQGLTPEENENKAGGRVGSC